MFGLKNFLKEATASKKNAFIAMTTMALSSIFTFGFLTVSFGGTTAPAANLPAIEVSGPTSSECSPFGMTRDGSVYFKGASACSQELEI